MFRLKTTCMGLMVGLLLPIPTYAANFCIAVNGGFGSGGTSYVAPTFVLPAHNHCAAWSGFTKTATTVIAIANGTACLSSDSRVLTLSVLNTDPPFFGNGATASDQVQLCPTSVTDCRITGQDAGYFAGTAAQQPCTSTLLRLPPTHD